jgi:hypothetical protein
MTKDDNTLTIAEGTFPNADPLLMLALLAFLDGLDKSIRSHLLALVSNKKYDDARNLILAS